MYLCANVVGRRGDDTYNDYETVVTFKNIQSGDLYS